jgi:NAD(P)-dependent dehydrogenase (short-subunit alcohol dehydrogenase family)
LPGELAPRGIRVNAVSLGPIETNFFERTGLPASAQAEFGAAILQRVPLGRFGKPKR